LHGLGKGWALSDLHQRTPAYAEFLLKFVQPEERNGIQWLLYVSHKFDLRWPPIRFWRCVELPCNAVDKRLNCSGEVEQLFEMAAQGAEVRELGNQCCGVPDGKVDSFVHELRISGLRILCNPLYASLPLFRPNGAQIIARSTSSPYLRLLARLLVERRKAARLTQVEVAQRLKRPQSFVASVENAERRVDVVELINLADAVGFDPADFVAELVKRGEDINLGA